uniref:E3 ubiquitin-protein ligase n=1 Tax=Romanomermis culicivorax TaxID=13658 RepID=A0A915I195_ROMCU
VGTGLGPTLEFYALVSRNLQKAALQLWRGESIKRKEGDSDKTEEYVSNQCGLYPLALGRHIKQGQLDKIKSKFKLIGKLLARALLDGRILDLPLSSVFYKWLLKDESVINIHDLSDLDPVLSKSLQYLIGQERKGRLGGVKYLEAKTAVESLELYFTIPGNPSVELIKAGKDTPVTIDNIQQYVDLVIYWLLRAGVSRQMEIMRDAFDTILPTKHLKLFLPEEMDQLFCGAKNDVEPWDPQMLRQTIHPDHGMLNMEELLHTLILSEYDEQQRRLFLQFLTGSPRLPVGGLKNLNPPFTAVRKHDGGHSADSHLPSVMTCVNYLKLPEYSTKEIMAQRLSTAITCVKLAFADVDGALPNTTLSPIPKIGNEDNQPKTEILDPSCRKTAIWIYNFPTNLFPLLEPKDNFETK